MHRRAALACWLAISASRLRAIRRSSCRTCPVEGLDRIAFARHYLVVARQTDIIEVDKATADRLKQRAAELGISIEEFLAAVAAETELVKVDPGEIAELERRWAKVDAGARTVPNEEVVRWLETWGTPGFVPWRDQ